MTSILGTNMSGRFPATRGSVVDALRSVDAAESARAFERIVEMYWRPAYVHFRLRWKRSADDARDLTQDFFGRVLERRQLVAYDRDKGTFRTYLRAALDHFIAEHDRAAGRLKRGGGSISLRLDFDVVERDLPQDSSSPESAFDDEWVRALLESSVGEFERHCRKLAKSAHFEIFRRYVLDDDAQSDVRPSYAELADELSIKVTDVTNYLAWSRRAFRTIVLERLRAMTSSEEEFQDEARAVLGVRP